MFMCAVIIVCTIIVHKGSFHDNVPMDTNPAYKMMGPDSPKEPTVVYEDIAQSPPVKMTTSPAYSIP